MDNDIARNITSQSVTHTFLEVKITILNKSAETVKFLQMLLFFKFLLNARSQTPFPHTRCSGLEALTCYFCRLDKALLSLRISVSSSEEWEGTTWLPLSLPFFLSSFSFFCMFIEDLLCVPVQTESFYPEYYTLEQVSVLPSIVIPKVIVEKWPK